MVDDNEPVADAGSPAEQQEPVAPALTDDHAEALLADALATAERINSQSAPDGKRPPWSSDDFDPERAWKLVENLRAEKATAAEKAKSDLAQTIGRALGLVQDDAPPDPAELTKRLTESQASARQAQVELAVYRNAGDADPAALLDSRSFLDRVKDVDPSDGDAFANAIAEAVQSNPRLAGAAAQKPRMKPDPAQGASASEPASLAEQAAHAAQAGDKRQAMLLKAQMALQSNPGL